MLNSFFLPVLLGAVLGFLSGIGVGGGSLLILWLTIVLDLPQQTARGINLLFFLPCALIACLFRWQQGCIHLRSVVPAILFGCICAFLFSLLSQEMNTEILKKLFGFLLLFTGIRELMWKQKRERHE